MAHPGRNRAIYSGVPAEGGFVKGNSRAGGGKALRRIPLLAVASFAFCLLAGTPGAVSAYDVDLWAKILREHTQPVEDIAGTRVDYAALRDSADLRALVASLEAERPAAAAEHERRSSLSGSMRTTSSQSIWWRDTTRWTGSRRSAPGYDRCGRSRPAESAGDPTHSTPSNTRSCGHWKTLVSMERLSAPRPPARRSAESPTAKSGSTPS